MIDIVQTASVIHEKINPLSSTQLCTYLLVPFLVLGYTYWRISRNHIIELGNKVPGPYGFPLVGCLHFLLGSPVDVFNRAMRVSKIFGTIVRLWFGPLLFIFIIDPRDAEVILSSSVHIDKSYEYNFFKPWLGDGLLISSGDKWRAHRKLIAPTFHLNVLKRFVELFNMNSIATVEKLKKLNGKTFDCHDYMSETTVEILLETAMGVSKKTQGKSGFEYAMAVMKMCDILHMRHLKPWLRWDPLFMLTSYARLQKYLLNVIHSLTRRVLKEKKEALSKGIEGSLAGHSDSDQTKEEHAGDVDIMSFGSGLKDDLDVEQEDVGEKKRKAFLELLLEASINGAPITDEEIREQVDTIMFEGHDTTAAASSFFLCMMGIHPHVQDKVVKELDGIFGASDRHATFNDTSNMKYLERCILETLRMYPPVPVIARKVNEDAKMKSGDYTIPAGATVIIGTYKIHRRADIYPNPDTFDPDNFLPEKCANRHYYAFIPFSAGPRSCVGRKYAMLKLKILLSTILRNFRVNCNSKETDFNLKADIILKREEGFPISLERRTLAS